MSTQSQPSPSSAPKGIKRRRPALACDQCRARKIRCDRTHPCASCQRSRNQHCTYAPDPQPRKKVTLLSPSIPSGVVRPVQAAGLGHGTDPTPAPRLCELDNPNSVRGSRPSPALADSLSPSKAALSTAQQTKTFIPGVVALTPESLPGNPTYANVASLESRIRQLEQELAKSRQLCEEEIGDRFQREDKAVITKMQYLGRSHWFNVAQLVRTALATHVGDIEIETLKHAYSRVCDDIVRLLSVNNACLRDITADIVTLLHSICTTKFLYSLYQLFH